MNQANARQYTIKLLEMVSEGEVDPENLIHNLVNFMSEAEVKEFCLTNHYVEEGELWCDIFTVQNVVHTSVALAQHIAISALGFQMKVKNNESARSILRINNGSAVYAQR